MATNLHSKSIENSVRTYRKAFFVLVALWAAFTVQTGAAQGLGQTLLGIVQLLSKGKQAEKIGALLEKMMLSGEVSLSPLINHIRPHPLFQHAEALARRDPLRPAEAAKELKEIRRRSRIAHNTLESSSALPLEASHLAELSQEANLLQHMEALALVRDVVAKTSHSDPEVARALLFKERNALERAVQTASESERIELFRRIEIIKDIMDIRSGWVQREFRRGVEPALAEARATLARLRKERADLEMRHQASHARSKLLELQEMERRLRLLESEGMAWTAELAAL